MGAARQPERIDSKLVGALVAVTEAGARAAMAHVGGGDPMAADGAAVAAMRHAFDAVPMCGTAVIGEGERDGAPAIVAGERLGRWREGDPLMDVALDPIECTRACAAGRPGAMSTIAVGRRGALLGAPDVRMNKIGGARPGVVDLSWPPGDNVRAFAHATQRPVAELRIGVMERERNAALIEALRLLPVALWMIDEGDLEPAILTAVPGSGIDLYLGIGGAPEGVLAASALRVLNGDFQGQLLTVQGSPDGPPLGLDQLAAGPVAFVATAITAGTLIKRPGDSLSLW